MSFGAQCQVPGCDRERKRGQFCWAHHYRWTTHGDVKADVPIRVPWRPGDPVTTDPIDYRSAHRRVVTAKGKASEYPCANGCGATAHHWSYVGSALEQTGMHRGRVARWSPDPEDYIPRCRTCHRREDVTLAFDGDPEYVAFKAPARVVRTPITSEVAAERGDPEGWLSCERTDCPKPAKRSPGGTPRRLCSAHQKERESARNTGPCAAEGCGLPRVQARRVCVWHVVHGVDAVMSAATRARSDKSQAS